MKKIVKVSDNKFKSIFVSYNFTFPIVKEKMPVYSILAQLLSKSTKKYKTEKEIATYLASLYGTGFEVNVEKVGDLFNMEFRLECVNKQYIPVSEDVLDRALQFLYQVIYEPNIEMGSFSAELFEREKLFILDKIKTRKDEKLKYAVGKTEELLCEDSPFGIYINGNEEDAKAVVLEDMIQEYMNIIQNAYISIILSGNLEGYDTIETTMQTIFKDKLETKMTYKTLKDSLTNTEIISTQIKEVTEKMQTNQAVITLGMKVENASQEDFYVLNVYNSILGSTPSSKLFQHVREKQSLAYTVRSRYYRFKGMLVIYAGIEEKNAEKAKQVITEQMKEMEQGNISDLELNSAKEALSNDLLEWKDSKTSLAKLQYTNLIQDKEVTIDEMIEEIKKVSREDVVKASKRIKVQLVYLLGGEPNEK